MLVNYQKQYKVVPDVRGLLVLTALLLAGMPSMALAAGHLILLSEYPYAKIESINWLLALIIALDIAAIRWIFHLGWWRSGFASLTANLVPFFAIGFFNASWIFAYGPHGPLVGIEKFAVLGVIAFVTIASIATTVIELPLLMLFRPKLYLRGCKALLLVNLLTTAGSTYVMVPYAWHHISEEAITREINLLIRLSYKAQVKPQRVSKELESLQYAQNALLRDDPESAYRLLEDGLVSEYDEVREKVKQFMRQDTILYEGARHSFRVESLKESSHMYGKEARGLEERRLSIYKNVAPAEDYSEAQHNFESVFGKGD